MAAREAVIWEWTSNIQHTLIRKSTTTTLKLLSLLYCCAHRLFEHARKVVSPFELLRPASKLHLNLEVPEQARNSHLELYLGQTGDTESAIAHHN